MTEKPEQNTKRLSRDSYEKMLFNANQRHKTNPAETTLCSCGKITFVKNLEKHQKTKLHQELYRRKLHHQSLLSV
jgi:hypothetical protein